MARSRMRSSEPGCVGVSAVIADISSPVLVRKRTRGVTQKLDKVARRTVKVPDVLGQPFTLWLPDFVAHRPGPARQKFRRDVVAVPQHHVCARSQRHCLRRERCVGHHHRAVGVVVGSRGRGLLHGGHAHGPRLPLGLHHPLLATDADDEVGAEVARCRRVPHPVSGTPEERGEPVLKLLAGHVVHAVHVAVARQSGAPAAHPRHEGDDHRDAHAQCERGGPGHGEREHQHQHRV